MIRIPNVRVVDENGDQLGVMPTPKALEMAQDRGLDLVEVAPMAAPPVVRFLDYGQYKYELAKRDKEAKRRSRAVEFKEVRLRPEDRGRRLRHQGPPGDRVPGGRRPAQGRGPIPWTRDDSPGARTGAPGAVRRADQGSRGRRAGAAHGGSVDAHDRRLRAQTEDDRPQARDQEARRGSGRRGRTGDRAGGGDERCDRIASPGSFASTGSFANTDSPASPDTIGRARGG